VNPIFKQVKLPLSLIALAALATASACGGGDSASAAMNPSPGTTSLAAGYKQAKWAAHMSVTYPTECSMTIVSNGQPNHTLDRYYLQPPGGSYTTVVAIAPQSGMRLVVVPYTASTVSTPMTFNTCPTKASATTPTTGGNIGIMISGPALFNATEGPNSRAAALTDKVSYNFKDSSGAAQTANFIDSCNGHPTPALQGNTYHYHGLPPCVTAQVDTAGGPSHIIGIAADGFPIYGNKDINGKVVTLAQLDECNGITSATPEFPNGVYHYVLPEGVTSFQSSLRCYSGAVTPLQMAALKSQGMCEAPAVKKAPKTTWTLAPMPLTNSPYRRSVSTTFQTTAFSGAMT
jgi:hypothetical protein